MSSAFLWIILPLFVGVALLAYRRQDYVPLWSGAVLCLFLTWVAWQLPVDVVLRFGPFSVEIAPSFIMFGRSFTLTQAHMPLLMFVYLFEAFWIIGTFLAKPPRLFIPISLICVALLVAALGVEPFLYAALLIAMAAMLLVPVLAPPGATAGLGVLRFLKFQVFAIPFILFTGWILSGVEASPGNLDLALRAGLLLGLGFAFLLAVFPFHSWMPMLASESHPYVVGFLIFFLPSFALIFGLNFFERYGWLGETQSTYNLLVAAGGLSTLVGGLWAFIERNPTRLMAYAAMVAIGFSLQAVGLGADGAPIFFALFLPFAWALWIWSTSLGFLSRFSPMQITADLRQLVREHPLGIAGATLAAFSLTGLPLLASFPGRLAVFDGVAALSPMAAIAALVGSLGLAGGVVRMLFALSPGTQKPGSQWREEGEPETKDRNNDLYNPYMWAFFASSTVLLLGFGVLSRYFLAAVPDLARLFVP